MPSSISIKAPVVGEVAHHAGDFACPGRVALRHLVPGVGLHLLDAERDFPCFSLLMFRTWTSIWSPMETSSLGWLMRLVPAHLADVHQALDGPAPALTKAP